MAKTKKDYSRYLVLYSGGADSTHFIENEPTAKYLIFFKGRNEEQANVAITNANLLDRYITVVEGAGPGNGRDGETNQIHALYDTQMAIDASIMALSHGMKGIIMCFNSDDIGIDTDSIIKIMKRAEPEYELLLPLINTSAQSIRDQRQKSSLKTISCMNGNDCGYCAKCKKKY
jgi:7-cyano-7-deazaguanine synthase in queuosine biosynthesis